MKKDNRRTTIEFVIKQYEKYKQSKLNSHDDYHGFLAAAIIAIIALMSAFGYLVYQTYLILK